MDKKRNLVEWAMHYRQIVILITSCLLAFGVFALVKINKNEFPDFTIRQGVVIAAYPGASVSDVEQQVTKPLENYIFTYKEVDKTKTKSFTRNGLSIIQIELNKEIDGEEKDNFWSKLKDGLNRYKSSLPMGVVAVQVQDDFGDTSALLITMESKDKTYRELKAYMDDLKDRLRPIESIGRLNVYGMQQEQVAVYIDNKRLSEYGISPTLVATQLLSKGFTTTAGTQRTPDYEYPIDVEPALNVVGDVEQTVVWNDAAGHVVRLKDIADVRREYPAPSSFITNNGRKCILLSVEMKKGKNITDMGQLIDEQISEFQKTLPKDVSMFTITNQSKVVSDSIINFLRELLIAIAAVVVVVLLLMPVRVALVAASTIPVSIFISLGLFYAFGIELNTVTLAALIVTLGMIVDNSIVIIDNYVELLGEGMSRWSASIQSATHFFKSIFSATLAISITFFPFLLTLQGMFHDFILYFPWAITIVLLVSLIVAEFIVPFMQFWFIRKPMEVKKRADGKPRFSFLDMMQRYYDWLITFCFRHYYGTLAAAVVCTVGGIVMMSRLPQKLMPTAERDQFAVEMFLPTGTSLQRTAQVADSLEHILRQDKRVVSVASFKGTSSPRFQTTYAPQMGGKNFAQFIVNTTDDKATVAVLKDYRMKYSDAFPDAYIRFKQLSYSNEDNNVEVRLSGSDWAQLKHVADSVTNEMRKCPQLMLVRNDVREPLYKDHIILDQAKASRLGITNAQVEMAMATRYSSDGLPLGTIWQGDYGTNVVLKGSKANAASMDDVEDEPIPVLGGVKTVPLRDVAKIEKMLEDGQICHRNGVRTITVMADVADGVNVMNLTKALQKQFTQDKMPEGVKLSWGGEYDVSGETMPQIVGAIAIAVVIIFFILLGHFRRISTSVLVLLSLAMTLFGAAIGVWVTGIDFSLTCFMGIISLMGILVRNAIIMFDYAEELRTNEHLTAHEAIFESAKRRMRPIFLTSAAASMGVIPMILGGSGLWMPMGVVIFFGTLITMLLILTVLPVAYWLMMSGSTKKRLASENIENE
ncbi:MAG: efflux RND transporter permease subunit [Prevotella sp.]|jgi:multidrug efflux pump subunit AcrB|nr:efflux RND transporter permease subunit [Prevotella sp.]MCI2079790.1 efflux RND transporter permease subunit [Prevotella sp.]MCI2101472.1 efflux RND transporter permease subunit [Prevotella sp.]